MVLGLNSKMAGAQQTLQPEAGSHSALPRIAGRSHLGKSPTNQTTAVAHALKAGQEMKAGLQEPQVLLTAKTSL